MSTLCALHAIAAVEVATEDVDEDVVGAASPTMIPRRETRLQDQANPSATTVDTAIQKDSALPMGKPATNVVGKTISPMFANKANSQTPSEVLHAAPEEEVPGAEVVVAEAAARRSTPTSRNQVTGWMVKTLTMMTQKVMRSLTTSPSSWIPSRLVIPTISQMD